MARSCKSIFSKSEGGFTLVELLVSVAVTGMVITLGSKMFIDISRLSTDNKIITRAEENARAILDQMAFDLRMMGSGVPIGQTNFAPGTVGLDDAPLPVILDATATHIELVLDEEGRTTLLSADYTPAGFSLDFDVATGEIFNYGDIVYISDATAGGDNGFRGLVTNISGDTISVDSDYVSSAGATFLAGSLVTRVRTVTYDSLGGDTGLQRTSWLTGTETLDPNATFELEYLDGDGAAIALPLSETEVANQLSSIRVTVTVGSDIPLKRGGDYAGQATQTIMLRNLVINR